jgi:hypothetical protein
MKVSKGFIICTFCAITFLLFTGNANIYASSSTSLLPEGLVIRDEFRPGFGSPVGKVLLVQGKALIMHGKERYGYRVKKNLPLFKGDIIVTLPRGRIRLKLNDGSVVTMASNTKFIINKSEFDSVKKRFVSFLGMSLGKARFWLVKVARDKHPEYKVKTPTAVMGVRGSDFVLEVADFTTVTAFEDTILEVRSLDFPEQPVILTEFKQTIVREGEIPDDPTDVPLEEIEPMKKEFIVTPSVGEHETHTEVGEQKAEGGTTVSAEKEGVLVSEDELVEPEGPGPPEAFREAPELSLVEEIDIAFQEAEALEVVVDIEESLIETVPAIQELPDFLGTPP